MKFAYLGYSAEHKKWTTVGFSLRVCREFLRQFPDTKFRRIPYWRWKEGTWDYPTFWVVADPVAIRG